jgi:hypothetical protein
VFIGDVICFTIFSGNSSQKNRFSNLLHQFARVHHQIFTIIYIACHDSLDTLFQNLGIWIQDSGHRRLKIKLILSLILRVNLRLGGYFI